MSYSEDDYLLLSGIQHFAFCRRQWALIHIEQQWSENYQTTAGEIMHKNAHNESLFEKRGNKMTARGLRIFSSVLGLTGQCDVVEFQKSQNGISVFGYDGVWNVIPVEYKRGNVKDGNEDELQLCAQAICLEEMFCTSILKGYLFYGESKKRFEVEFSDELRNNVFSATKEMHTLFHKGYTPVVKPTSKCKSCSLNNLCLPKMCKNTDVKKYINDNICKSDGDDI